MLARFGFHQSESCGCASMSAQMDAWGCDEASRPERIEEVVAVMRAEAKARGLPFLDLAGRMLVRRAISIARRLTRPADPLPSRDSQPARRPQGEDPVDTGSDHHSPPREGSPSLGDQPPG